jgi:hypothetical protein
MCLIINLEGHIELHDHLRYMPVFFRPWHESAPSLLRAIANCMKVTCSYNTN